MTTTAFALPAVAALMLTAPCFGRRHDEFRHSSGCSNVGVLNQFAPPSRPPTPRHLQNLWREFLPHVVFSKLDRALDFDREVNPANR